MNQKVIEKWQKLNLASVLIYSIAFVFVSVSALQSAKGYEPFFKNFYVAVAIAIAVSAGLFLYDHFLKQELEGRRSPWHLGKLFAIYCCIALASFAGNFNAIFTNAVGKLPFVDQLKSVQVSIAELENSVIAELSQGNTSIKIKNDVESLLPSLRSEIMDVNNPGIGPGARKYIRKIEKILGAPINIPSSSTTDVITAQEAAILYKQVETNIRGILDSKMMNSKQHQLADTIRKKAADADGLILSTLTQKESVEEQTLEQQLDLAITAYNELLAIARSQQMNCAEGLPDWRLAAAQTGQFDATLELLRSGHYPNQAWAAAGQSFFLDFIVPIMLLGIVRRQEDPVIVKLKEDIQDIKAQLDRLDKQVQQTILNIRSNGSSKIKVTPDSSAKRGRKRRPTNA